MTTTKKLFQEIVSVQDKMRILSRLKEDRTPILARVKKGVEFKTTPLNWQPPMRMEVEAPAKTKLGLQTLTLQFDCQSERYFTQAELAFDDWKLYFIYNKPIFRLQRRQYQRLLIPQKYKNRVLLMKINDADWNEECEVVDISLGGCSLRLGYNCLNENVGSLVMLDLQIGDHPSFLQMGRICYMQPQKHEGKNKVRMGIQFKPHPKYTLYLQTIIQNLAVDIFVNWSQRK